MPQDSRKSFVLYYDMLQHLSRLSMEERGQLITVLLQNRPADEEPEDLSDRAAMAYSFIRAQIERDAEKYDEVCRKRSEAGKMGGRPKGSKAPPGSVENQEDDEKKSEAKKANAFSEKQSKAKKADNGPFNEPDLYNEPDLDNEQDTVTETREGRGASAADAEGLADIQTQRFEQFWKEYPKKVGKTDARKAWKRAKVTADLFEKILNAVGAARASEQWQREGGRFIPNPATWINQGRWDDELPPATGYTQQQGPRSEAKQSTLSKLRSMYEQADDDQ